MNIGKFSPWILFLHGEAPSENLLPNQRFGFETVPSRTVSTSDNHYKRERLNPGIDIIYFTLSPCQNGPLILLICVHGRVRPRSF